MQKSKYQLTLITITNTDNLDIIKANIRKLRYAGFEISSEEMLFGGKQISVKKTILKDETCESLLQLKTKDF